MFYLAVFIWGVICLAFFVAGMDWIEKQDKNRKR
jgi:hypothetical protein